MEATRDDDRAKLELCSTNRYPVRGTDWIKNTYVMHEAQNRWNQERDITDWLERSRRNLARGVLSHGHEPRMQSAITRLLTYVEPAIANLKRLERLTEDVA